MLFESTFPDKSFSKKISRTQDPIWVLDTVTFLQTVTNGYHFPINAKILHKVTFL